MAVASIPHLLPVPVADPLGPLDLPRLRLGEAPTPVRQLDLGDGADLWIKDDGAFAAHGGNKARKLEWLLADAQRRGARTVITGGRSRPTTASPSPATPPTSECGPCWSSCPSPRTTTFARSSRRSARPAPRCASRAG